MQSILITGGNGQLGRSLQKIAKDYPGYRFVFTDLPEMDIADRAAVDEKIEGSGAVIIINCAAYTDVDGAETESSTAFRVNAEGPAVLAAAARERGIKLVHISTDYVFGGYEHDTPYTETDATAPINVYGESKLAGEKAVYDSGCDAAVIRTSWLYSEFGRNFVKTMLRLARERDKIQVVDDQFGSPTYAADLARAVMVVVERGIEGCELYHYCNGGSTSWFGFAKAVFEFAGLRVDITGIPSSEYVSKAKRADYTVLDTSKIRGIGAKVPKWQYSLEKCLVELGEK